MFFVRYFDGVFVVVILDVILETGSTERESVGLKVSPNNDRTVMAATSKSVGVSIPHGSWKVLVTLPEVHRSEQHARIDAVGIPGYLDRIEDPCTPPLILEFPLNFVKPCQIFFITWSRHRSEHSGLGIHKPNIDNSDLVKGRRGSRTITREKSWDYF